MRGARCGAICVRCRAVERSRRSAADDQDIVLFNVVLHLGHVLLVELVVKAAIPSMNKTNGI